MAIRTILLLVCSALSLCAADAAYSCKVGDKIEGWNVADWYPATVTQIGSGNYQGYCYVKFDNDTNGQWVDAKNIRARKDATKNKDAAASQTPPVTKYLCGVYLNTRFTYTQAVTLKGGGAYETSTGGSGRYQYEAGSKRIIFDGGPFKDLFGRYEAENHQIVRLTMKEDAAKSSAAQNWRSQVCSPQK